MNTCTIKAEALGAKRAGAEMRPVLDLRPALAAGLAAIVAIAIQSLWIPIDADVSWLITVSDRILSGDRLYIDIFELNPPASVWLYVPLVWLAQLLGARPEAVVVAAFVCAGLVSVMTSVRLASRLDDAPRPVWLAGVLSFITLVLPMALFAQREHAALLLALPALAAMANIAEGKPLGRGTHFAAGFAAGLVIVIKPYFLFAVIAPALWVVLKRKSLTPLFPAITAATTAIGLYAIAVLLFARAYFNWLPVITHTYAPMHDAIWKVVIAPALYPAICLGLALLLRAQRIPAITATCALGAIGFLLAAYVQAKNYPNHWLPGGALALAGACAMLQLPRIASARRVAVAIGLAVVALGQMHHWTIRPDAAVAEAIQRLAPPAPKILALSPQLTTGHPVTRNVDGQWVGSRAGLFTAAGARFAGLDDPLERQYYREDINAFAIDLERGSPDVVLVHRPTKAWLMGELVIAQAMSGYRFEALVNDTEIWLRRDVHAERRSVVQRS